jgi:hypothetical protein
MLTTLPTVNAGVLYLLESIAGKFHSGCLGYTGIRCTASLTLSDHDTILYDTGVEVSALDTAKNRDCEGHPRVAATIERH